MRRRRTGDPRESGERMRFMMPRPLRVQAWREVMRGGAWIAGISARRGEGPSTPGYRGAFALDSDRRFG